MPLEKVQAFPRGGIAGVERAKEAGNHACGGDEQTYSKKTDFPMPNRLFFF